MKREWRCKHCQKLLGVLEGRRIRIRFARGHQYIVGLPGASVCRSCQTLNEIDERQKEAAPSMSEDRN